MFSAPIRSCPGTHHAHSVPPVRCSLLLIPPLINSPSSSFRSHLKWPLPKDALFNHYLKLLLFEALAQVSIWISNSELISSKITSFIWEKTKVYCRPPALNVNSMSMKASSCLVHCDTLDSVGTCGHSHFTLEMSCIFPTPMSLIQAKQAKCAEAVPQWFPKCGSQTNSTTWKHVRNANFEAPLSPTELELMGKWPSISGLPEWMLWGKN